MLAEGKWILSNFMKLLALEKQVNKKWGEASKAYSQKIPVILEKQVPSDYSMGKIAGKSGQLVVGILDRGVWDLTRSIRIFAFSFTFPHSCHA